MAVGVVFTLDVLLRPGRTFALGAIIWTNFIRVTQAR